MHDHAKRIGKRDPIHAVNKHSEIPIAHSTRVNPADKREVASHHQPLDVVAVPGLNHLTNTCFHASHVSVSGPIEVRQLALLIKSIAIRVLRALKPVNTADELAPTNDLPYERLH